MDLQPHNVSTEGQFISIGLSIGWYGQLLQGYRLMCWSLTYFNNFIGEIIKAEWEKLRENYRKCLTKREKATRSGAAAKKLPTCNFFAELSFLRDTLLNQRTESNLSQPPANLQSWTKLLELIHLFSKI